VWSAARRNVALASTGEHAGRAPTQCVRDAPRSRSIRTTQHQDILGT